MKNLLIKWIITLCKPGRPHSEPSSFLIVSTTGLGDSLWGTPAVRALREAHPKAYIALLTLPIGEAVFRNNPHLSAIFVAKKPLLFSLLAMFKTLKQKRFGTIFIFHTSQRLILPFCSLLGAERIVGTEGINKGLDFLLTHPLPAKPVHEIARRLDILGKSADKPFLEIFPDQRDKASVEEFFSTNKIAAYLPLIALHPGAKDRFKQWPVEHFITLGNLLVEATGCQIFITGNQEELPLLEKVAAAIPGAIPMGGTLGVRAFAVFLHKLDLFITNDTGPMHIAFAMNAPTIALFTPTDPKRCGPYLASRATVIAHAPTCTPCRKKRCPLPFCLYQISPQAILKTALAKLRKQE